MELRERQHGGRDWQVMDTLLKLGMVHAELQNFEQMTEFFHQILKIAGHLGDAERVGLARLLRGKMISLLAKCLLVQALAPARVPHCPPELSGFLLRFGVCRQLLKGEVAENALERFIEIQEQCGGWNEVAKGLEILATSFRSQTVLESSEGIKLLERACDLVERQYGCEHSVTAVAAAKLRSAYDWLGAAR